MLLEKEKKLPNYGYLMVLTFKDLILIRNQCKTYKYDHPTMYYQMSLKKFDCHNHYLEKLELFKDVSTHDIIG